MRKLWIVFTVMCLAIAGMPGIRSAAGEGAAEGPVLEEKALELSGSSVSFPAVIGMADADLEKNVNMRIREDLHVDEYLQRMNALISDEARTITVTWSGEIVGDIFSGLLEADAKVKSVRRSHEWTWSNIDLRDGHEITLDELFTDADAAREALEAYLEETVAPELNPLLENSAVTPLPEGFRIDGTGLTLLYRTEQLNTLSDRAGAVKLGWNEIREYLDWSEDGIPARIGAAEAVNLTEDSAPRIREMTEGGRLPEIPVNIGDRVKEWTDKTRLLNDPEEYAGGRMFAPEGAVFRDVYLLTDAVSSRWDDSLVQGIRMDRGCVWGLCIGETEASQWHQLLGEPDNVASFDEETAENFRTVPGTCDYYEFGKYRLQLQADEAGILRSITLAE